MMPASNAIQAARLASWKSDDPICRRALVLAVIALVEGLLALSGVRIL